MVARGAHKKREDPDRLSLSELGQRRRKTIPQMIYFFWKKVTTTSQNVASDSLAVSLRGLIHPDGQKIPVVHAHAEKEGWIRT